MTRSSRLHRLAVVAFTLSVLLLAGCAHTGTGPEFSLRVLPENDVVIAAGQPCLLVLQVEPSRPGEEDALIALAVEVTGAQAVISPTPVRIGDVAEVMIVPEPERIDRTITLFARGTSAQSTDVSTWRLQVVDGFRFPDERVAHATALRDRFLAWLLDAHPELPVLPSSTWEPILIRPLHLVVSHCLFVNAQWELAVWWHVTAPPNDWARIYLRRRFEETAPSFSAQIDSAAEASVPIEIHPPPCIFR